MIVRHGGEGLHVDLATAREERNLAAQAFGTRLAPPPRRSLGSLLLLSCRTPASIAQHYPRVNAGWIDAHAIAH